jgi:16S rRNA processing protein RimM|tara:strand:- start:332 stop:847 length:516 start_codon:yes stop_codon:yes gene_type:complete
MEDDKKIYLGKITGVHGIKGWLKIQSFSSPPENILNYPQWIINNQGEEDLYSIEKGRKQNNKIVVKLENINDRNTAEALINSKIQILRSDLPKLSNENYYWSDLVGLNVLNSEEKMIGKIESLIETGANDVMVINSSKNKRILIPFVMHEIVKEVNIELSYVKVDWSMKID